MGLLKVIQMPIMHSVDDWRLTFFRTDMDRQARLQLYEHHAKRCQRGGHNFQGSMFGFFQDHDAR